MNPLRALAQRVLRARIYRERWLPWGLDFAVDAARRAPEVRFRTVFDVGANEGQSARGFARSFPGATIWSFEPFGATYRRLVAVTQGLDVRCFQLAMGAEAGSMAVALSDQSVNNSLGNTASTGAAGPVETVTVGTLDGFAAEHGVGHIDFLKVDTEGFDLEVLKGAGRLLRSGAITFVQVEAGMNPQNRKHVPFQELSAHLVDAGYTLFGLYEQTPEWTGEARLRFANAVFTTNAIANRRRE